MNDYLRVLALALLPAAGNFAGGPLATMCLMSGFASFALLAMHLG